MKFYWTGVIHPRSTVWCKPYGGHHRGETTGGRGGWHSPQSLSRRIYPYNFVGQILKIFRCLGLKSNSCRKNFDKCTKILFKHRKVTEKCLFRLYSPESYWKMLCLQIFLPPPPCSPTILGKEIRAFFKRLQLLGPSLDEDLAQLPVLKGGAIPIWKRGGRVSENSPTHFKS